jgi:hypothetical protein
MNAESLKEAVRRELPALLREDPEFRAYVLELVRQESAPRAATESRFDRVLAELQRDREAQTRKWEEQRLEGERKWEEQNRKWDEQNRKWEAQNRKWEAQRLESERKWEEQNRKWDEQNRYWEAQRAERERDREEQNRKWEAQRAERERDREEQNRKWEENQERFNRVHEEIMAQARKFDRGIGALGARWGIQSEVAFRNALAGILEESFGVQVINVNEFDDEGVVFGRPEQVELDIIVKDGLLLICELKSSMSKPDMYTFERKARFYEQRHQRRADRLLVISPMIDHKAQAVAQLLGIETYTDSTDVEAI